MSPRVAIHREPLGQAQPRLLRYECILQHNGYTVEWLDSSERGFWERLPGLDLFIYHWGQWDAMRQNAQAILPVIECELGVPCYPDQRTGWSFDDKVRQYCLLAAHRAPVVDSWVFWEKKAALAWGEEAELPVVFKLSGGAGSKNVVLVKDRRRLRKLVRAMFGRGVADGGIPGRASPLTSALRGLATRVAMWKRTLAGQPVSFRFSIPNWIRHKNYVLFQKYIPDNAFDIRVTTIGARAFAFRRFVRDGDFRASGSGRIDWTPEEIPKACLRIALDLSAKVGFQTMAYDFLMDGQQPRICEISYTFASEAVQQCPGHWDSDLNWRRGRLWPEFLVLKDCLKAPSLEQPEGLHELGEAF